MTPLQRAIYWSLRRDGYTREEALEVMRDKIERKKEVYRRKKNKEGWGAPPPP